LFPFEIFSQSKNTTNFLYTSQWIWYHVSKELFGVVSEEIDSFVESDFWWGPGLTINVFEWTGSTLQAWMVNILVDCL
jgi:hypothetical protein